MVLKRVGLNPLQPKMKHKLEYNALMIIQILPLKYQQYQKNKWAVTELAFVLQNRPRFTLNCL